MLHPIEERINHYKLWRLESPHVRLKVEDTEWDTPLGCPEFIANPTRKRRRQETTPVVDEKLHLIAYRILENRRAPRHEIAFSNQFGGPVGWLLDESEFLLVPAAKLFAPDRPQRWPQGATHYVCYRVRHGDVIHQEIWLRDQFDRHRDIEERVQQLRPRFLGLPAIKNDEPIGDPDALLAIYEILPHDATLTESLVVNTLDQFGERQFRGYESWLIAVPSWELQAASQTNAG